MSSQSSQSDTIVIVGGGVAGLAAALLLAESGKKIALIESAPVPGGLLGSRPRGSWGDFDFGTHVLAETGIVDLDTVLFPGMRESPEWVRHKHCLQDIFFAGQRKDSPFIDARLLGPEVHARAWAEVTALPPATEPQASLADRVETAYGPTLKEHLFRPVMDKMFGTSLEELSTDAHMLFGLRRLILGTEEETRTLKAAHAWHDDRLAFHQVTEGASSILNFYPRERGIGLWVEQTIARLQAAGAEIHTSAKISSLELDSTRTQVTALVLDDGKRLPCGSVIWSAPAIHLLKLASVPLPSGMSPPRQRRTLLADMVLDRPLNTTAHYVTCYDPTLRTFRVTHYGSLQGTPDKVPAKVTLEVLAADTDGGITPDLLLRELMAMNLVPPDTHILESWLDEVSHGFPILTPALQKNTVILADLVHQHLSNVILGGRASGRVFFMKDVLTDMFRQVQMLP